MKIVDKSTRIENQALQGYIKQKPNRKILGIIRFHLGLYNLANENKMRNNRVKSEARLEKRNLKRSKRGKKNIERTNLTFGEWLIDVGEAPVIYDSVLTKRTVKQLQLLLRNKGYFQNDVKDSIAISGKKASVFYLIKTGKPYAIQTIERQIEDKELQQLILADTNQSYLKKGMPYDVDALSAERDRLATMLNNSGYYYFSKEYVYYTVDSSLGNQRMKVILSIKNPSSTNDSIANPTKHQTYTVKNVFISLATAEGANLDTVTFEGYKIIFNKPLAFKPQVLSNAIFIKPGEQYSTLQSEATYKRLAQLNSFKTINIQYKPNSDFSNTLNCYIKLTPILRQAFTVQTEGTNTSGALGIAGSLVYENKNLLKGAEVLEIRLRGGLEVQNLINESSQSNVKQLWKFNTIEFGPEANLRIPKFLLPFDVKVSKKTNPRTTFTSALSYQSRPDYERTITNMSFNYMWNETATKTHQIVPFEVNYVGVTLQPNLEAVINATNDLLLRNSFTPHLTTATRYSYTYNEQNIKKQASFRFFKADLESSGNLLRLLNSSLGSIKSADGSYRIFGIPYAQYLRCFLDYRYYRVVNPYNKIVLRTAGGVGKALSNLGVLPFEKSFYGGGTSGMRAWKARTLGPGSFPSENQQNIGQIGDMQLEANFEYRFNIFKMLNGALFADAGNIWLLKANPTRPNGEFEFNRFYKEIALGAGLGARVDFSFFIIRLDAAVKLRDPIFGEKGRWVIRRINDSIWKENFRLTHQNQSYSFINLNLGIGYPF